MRLTGMRWPGSPRSAASARLERFWVPSVSMRAVSAAKPLLPSRTELAPWRTTTLRVATADGFGTNVSGTKLKGDKVLERMADATGVLWPGYEDEEDIVEQVVSDEQRDGDRRDPQK